MNLAFSIIDSRQLVSYIAEKYEPETLAVFRVLSSFEWFRQSASSLHKLSGLFAMSLLSFERYLREQENVHISSGQGRSMSIRYGGSGRDGALWAEWEDDALFSVYGRLVHTLRQLYPDGDSLPSSPLAKTARGVDVERVLADINIHQLVEFLNEAHQLVSPDQWDRINDYHRALVAGEEVRTAQKYATVNQLHSLAVAARIEPIRVTVRRPLPFATPDEIMAVICGTMRKSLCPPVGGCLPKAITSSFTEIYPDAEVRDGSLLLYGQVEWDLLDAAGLPHCTVELGERPALPQKPAVPHLTAEIDVAAAVPKALAPADIGVREQGDPGAVDGITHAGVVYGRSQ